MLPPVDVLRRNRYVIPTRPVVASRQTAEDPSVDQAEAASAAPSFDDLPGGCNATDCQVEAASAARPFYDDFPWGLVEAASSSPSYEDLPRGCYATPCQVEAASAAPSSSITFAFTEALDSGGSASSGGDASTAEELTMGPPAFAQALDSGVSASSGGAADLDTDKCASIIRVITELDELLKQPKVYGPILEETERDGRWVRWHLALLEYYQQGFMRYSLRGVAHLPKCSKPAGAEPPTPILYKRPASSPPFSPAAKRVCKMRGTVLLTHIKHL